MDVTQRPLLKDFVNGLRSHQRVQGAIEVQQVQGAIEVVKRFETWVKTIGVTFWKGWSVGRETEKCDRVSQKSRCITSRCTGTEGNAIGYDAE